MDPIENNFKTFDITDIQNDFIYKLIDYYLDETTNQPLFNLSMSISNMVDTVMSFYLLSHRNGVINVDNSRKMLDTKINNQNNLIFNEDNQILPNIPMDRTLSENIENKIEDISSTKKDQCDIPEIDNLINDHENFITEISKQSSTIRNASTEMFSNNETSHTFNSDTDMTTTEIINKITELENKLKMELANTQNALINFTMSQSNINSSDIEEMFSNTQSENSNSTDLKLNTEEVNIIGQYSHKSSEDSIPLQKLDLAFNNLYTRLNTPIINLIIGFIFLRMISFIFGF